MDSLDTMDRSPFYKGFFRSMEMWQHGHPGRMPGLQGFLRFDVSSFPAKPRSVRGRRPPFSHCLDTKGAPGRDLLTVRSKTWVGQKAESKAAFERLAPISITSKNWFRNRTSFCCSERTVATRTGHARIMVEVNDILGGRAPGG
jgi:hypothetical protein